MGRPSKEEVERALGQEQLKAVRDAAKENLSGDEQMQQLKELVDRALALPSQPIAIQVSRKSPLKSGYKYIGTIDYVDAQSLSTLGIMHIVRDYSGGGDYECIVRVQGLEDRTVRFAVEGDPLMPKPERLLQPPQASFPQQTTPPLNVFQQMPQQFPQQFPVGATMPWMPQQLNPLNPMHQQIMQGYNPYQQAQQNQQNQPMDKMIALFEKMMNEQRELIMNSGEDPERRRLEEELRESKRRTEKAEEERRREAEQREANHRLEEMERRHIEMINTLKNQQPQVNTSLEITKALAPILGPLLPTLLTRGEEQARAMNEMFRGILEGQKNASDSQARTYETLLNRPGAEDRIIKVSEAVAKSQASTVGLVGTLLNGILQERAGDNPPPWLQIVSQLIDTGGGVAQSILGGAFSDDIESTAEEPRRQMQPPSLQSRVIPGEVAGQEARARVLGRGMATPKQISAEQTQTEPPAPEETLKPAATSGTPRIEQFDTAMQTIFTMIVQGGDTREIAFRLWKHAASGVKIAFDWFNHPEQATPLILGALREADQLTVSDERIAEIAAAIREFNDYLSGGGTPEAYLNQHKIGVRMPRATRPVVSARQTTEGGPEFGEHQDQPAPVGNLKIIDAEATDVPTPLPTYEPTRPSNEPVDVHTEDIDARTARAHAAQTGPILRRPQIVKGGKKEEEERREDQGKEEAIQQPAATP